MSALITCGALIVAELGYNKLIRNKICIDNEGVNSRVEVRNYPTKIVPRVFRKRNQDIIVVDKNNAIVKPVTMPDGSGACYQTDSLIDCRLYARYNYYSTSNLDCALMRKT